MKTLFVKMLSAIAISALFGLAVSTVHADEHADEVSPAVGSVPEPEASEKAMGDPDDYYKENESTEAGRMPEVEPTETDDEEYEAEYEDHPAGPATQVQ
jgi:hypothetical protein